MFGRHLGPGTDASLLDCEGGRVEYSQAVSHPATTSGASPGGPIAALPGRLDVWARRGLLALLVGIFVGYALWGIAAPLAWGHYGYHAGFHGAAARNLARHGVFTPTPYVGQSAPPEGSAYLHHPIICPQYLVPFQWVLGDHAWVIRLIPVLFTLATLLVVVAVGRRFWGPWGGLLAGAVYVLLPHNMVFCHLYDHETPGVLYSLAGVVGLLSFLQAPRLRSALLCLVGFGLAGVTDWPPYFIAFAAAWSGFGYLLVASFVPRSPLRVLVWLGGVGGLAVATHWALVHRVGWPGWMLSTALFCLALGALLAAAELGSDADSTPRARGVGWSSALAARPILWRWGLLAAMCLTVLFTFWFHFQYTRWVGMGADLDQAFRMRSGSPDVWPLASKYFTLVHHTYTSPVLLLAGAWLLSIPLRLALGRPMLRAALPMIFFTGQLLHNFKFPNEVDVHNYRTYYFVVAASFAAMDVLWELAAALRWGLARLLPGDRPRRVALLSAGVMAPLLVGLLGWQAREALVVLKEGRSRSGTLLYRAPYRRGLELARFFEEVRRRTSRRTLVLVTRDLGPRFEALWYLDRDYLMVSTLPRSREGAMRLARRAERRLIRRLSRAKGGAAESAWSRVWHRGQGGPRGGARGRRGRGAGRRWAGRSGLGDLRLTRAKRPVVALLSAHLGRRHEAAFRRVIQEYPVARIGPYYLIDFERKGPEIAVWRMRLHRPSSRVVRYLRGPFEEVLLERDIWQEWRILSRYGLPVGGQPALEHPPSPSAGRYNWVAYYNSRRVAGDLAGVALARARLARLLGGFGDRPLSPEIVLRGAVVGHTTVEVFLEATRTHRPSCRLRMNTANLDGARRRHGRLREVVPGLERWLAGVIYIVHFPLPSRGRGRQRLTLHPCFEGRGSPPAYAPVLLTKAR